jgi:hypothetical protein
LIRRATFWGSHQASGAWVSEVVLDAVEIGVFVDPKLLDAPEHHSAGAPIRSVDCVALLQRQLGEVGAVLTGDAGDHGCFHNGFSPCLETTTPAAAVAPQLAKLCMPETHCSPLLSRGFVCFGPCRRGQQSIGLHRLMSRLSGADSLAPDGRSRKRRAHPIQPGSLSLRASFRSMTTDIPSVVSG